MRVIAGTRRSLPLRTVPGLSTRPTTDRIKETLFNILQPEIPGARFLDLFAGSGAIGIEALSRGAVFAVFIEKDARAASCIRENLSFTKLDDQAKLMKCDVLFGLSALEHENADPFDLVFMDPPYGQGDAEAVLRKLASSPLVGPDTLIVVEESVRFDPQPLESLPFTVVRDKKYKTNRHLFLRRVSEDPVRTESD